MTTKILASIISILLFSCKSNDSCENMTSRDVCVTIINQSGQSAKQLFLNNDSGVKDIGVLKNNSQTSVIYERGGEGSYIILAILDNGDTLKSQGTYTEGGWKMTEIITKDSIKPKFKDTWF